MATPIGFIGLGAMGAPMAQNLLKAGFPLTVYNRTPERVEPLRAAGAAVALSPRAVTERAEIVIIIVSDSAAVEAVILGDEGVLAGLRPDSVVIDASTIAPDTTRKIAEAVRNSGSDLLDAPVSGGVAGAMNGSLSIMVGGSPDAFQRCLPVFEVLGKKITHIGPSGTGQTAKLINQIIGMGTLAAVADGLKLAQAAKLDVSQMIEVVGAGAASSWQLLNTGRLMAADDWRPGFRITLALKDLRLALAEAEALELSVPTAQTVATLFEDLVDAGQGDAGVQALGKTEK